MSRSLMQWHPEAHKQWAHERLVFWRLGFYPTYRRDDVLEALDLICARHGISGRTIYEVFGIYDLLLRFWLPESAATETVDLDIKRTLASFHLELCDHFEVELIDRLGFWWTGARAPAPSDPDDDLQVSPKQPAGGGLKVAVLEPRPNHYELSRINKLVERFNSGAINLEEVEFDDLAADLLDRKVLGVRESESGIKFTMVVSTSGATASRYTAMESLGSVLVEILERAEAVNERSLYRGTGFGRFMIL